MMDEMNNHPTDEKQEIEFDEDVEPIETIERTVEDLKRKIQELSISVNQFENTEVKTEESVTEETVIEEVEMESEDQIEVTSEPVEETVEEVTEDKKVDELAKTLDFIKNNAISAIESTRSRIEFFCRDEKVQKYEAAAQEVLGKARDKAAEAGKYVNDRIDDETKEKLNEAYAAAQEQAKKVVEAVQEFAQREDVQRAVSNAMENAKVLADKSYEMLRKYFEKSEDEEDL